jgi:pimeloyl-ACP methyl ester carboxylesterase
VVYVHASGDAPRWTWQVPWVRHLVHDGFAFFSYDKRGVGESEGVCCPGDEGHFNLVAADAVGAISALRSRREIDPSRIGFLGVSQAGWIVPLAAARSSGRTAFAAIVSGAATTTGEEEQWSEAAGEEQADAPPLTAERKAELTADLHAAGFDPVPSIRRLTGPALWLFGGDDRSVPAGKSAASSSGCAPVARTSRSSPSRMPATACSTRRRPTRGPCPPCAPG